jgi:nucleoside-diphosphate-sugar epimerase
MVTMKLKAKKSSQWMGDIKKIHTFTYTPDAGKATAILGNTPSAYNQTWHALTSKDKITGEQYVKIASELMSRPNKIQALPKFGVQLLGLFVPVLKEFVEMMYQYENDYIFDSTKFEKAFNFQATEYKVGIAETLR